MRLFPIAPALLLAPVLLLGTACTVEPPPVPASPRPTCGAEALQNLVGQPARALQTMRFGQDTRIIRPGMAVTMDYREERLNIEIDSRERIIRVYCG